MVTRPVRYDHGVCPARSGDQGPQGPFPFPPPLLPAQVVVVDAIVVEVGGIVVVVEMGVVVVVGAVMVVVVGRDVEVAPTVVEGVPVDGVADDPVGPCWNVGDGSDLATAGEVVVGDGS